MSDTHSHGSPASQSVLRPGSEKAVDVTKEGPTVQTDKQQPKNQIQSNPPESTQMSRVVWVFFVASIISSPFLFGFDLIVVGNVQPKIVEELGEVNKLPWISVAYALAAMSTTLLWGRLFGLFNIKYVFIASVLIFEAGSALSGAAPNMNTLIAGRALSGLGAVGTYAGAMNTLAVVTPIAQRPLYISFITLAYGSSTILAPIIGGAFADSSPSWRWSFYINICISGLFAPGYLFLFPSKVILPGKTLKERFSRLDPLGNLLWVGSTTSGLMAISFGGALYDWNSGRIIGLFVCSGVLLIIFALQQWRTIGTSVDTRIFPVILLASKEMCILFVQVAASSAVATVPVFLIPIYFEFAHGSSAIRAGLHLLPLVILRSVGILLNGFLMRKFGYTMPWYLVGAVLCLAGSAPLMTVGSGTSSGNIYGYSVLLGAGVGLYNQASFAVAQARTEPKLVPQAIAFITCGQVVGTGISLAIANSIFINQAGNGITRILPQVPRRQVQQAISGAGSSLIGSLTPAQRDGITQAIVGALNHSYGTMVAASALSLVLAAFMKRDKLFQQPK